MTIIVLSAELWYSKWTKSTTAAPLMLILGWEQAEQRITSDSFYVYQVIWWRGLLGITQLTYKLGFHLPYRSAILGALTYAGNTVNGNSRRSPVFSKRAIL